MPIFITNTLTRKKEEFIPLKAPQVNIYTCGVTVYDVCHIGHSRSLYTFDLMRRYLRYRGFSVGFVRNITDIEDKIINRSRELNVGWRELVDKYIASYNDDLASLGVEKADAEPRATENIPEMIAHIQGLIDKGFAYESGGDVYFNVRKFPSYGKLSGQGIDSMLGGTRIEANDNKKDALDFALWKRSKEGEPSWESPWGAGRPGWHIECSVMSRKYLKADTIDIHAGGRDLVFPHHENEIAQSEALTGKPFAKYWIHHGLLTINGQKMSKSLGNFITIRDFLGKYRDANLLKLFFLGTHYAHPIDYTEEKIEEARRAYERIDILMGKLEAIRTEPGSEARDSAAAFQEFLSCMDDDFNTPKALAVMFELVNLCNKLIDGNEEGRDRKLIQARQVLKEMAGIFGLSFQQQALADAAGDIEKKVTLRAKLKKEKKFAEADRIRKELEKEGIILEDTKDGTTWRRKI